MWIQNWTPLKIVDLFKYLCAQQVYFKLGSCISVTSLVLLSYFLSAQRPYGQHNLGNTIAVIHYLYLTKIWAKLRLPFPPSGPPAWWKCWTHQFPPCGELPRKRGTLHITNDFEELFNNSGCVKLKKRKENFKWMRSLHNLKLYIKKWSPITSWRKSYTIVPKKKPL